MLSTFFAVVGLVWIFTAFFTNDPAIVALRVIVGILWFLLAQGG
jgi:hypothetical protein